VTDKKILLCTCTVYTNNDDINRACSVSYWSTDTEKLEQGWRPCFSMGVKKQRQLFKVHT